MPSCHCPRQGGRSELLGATNFKMDYKILRELLKGNELIFKNNFDKIKENLPEEMLVMKGIKQSEPHEDIDPLDHTFNVMGLLGEVKDKGAVMDTRDLNEHHKEILRCGTLYHDIGKGIDALDTNHRFKSAELAQKHVEKMGYSEEEIHDILKLAETHDLLARLSKGLEGGGLKIKAPVTLEQAVEEIETERLLKLHYILIYSDFGATPGFKYMPHLVDALNSINRSYEKLSEVCNK